VRFPRGDEREGERGARISGITVTPLSLSLSLSHHTLFHRECREQTITNSTNEALQYRGKRKRRRHSGARDKASK